MKAKTVKRILGLLLSMTLGVSMLVGCGDTAADNKTSETVKESAQTPSSEVKEESKEEVKKPEDYPTLRIFFRNSERADSALVSEAMSEYTREKIGCNVELNFIPTAEYQQKISMMLATNEQMDIGWDATSTFRSKVTEGAYMDIADLLEARPNLKSIYTDERFLLGVKDGDGIYGLPTLKEMGEQWGLYVETYVLEQNNIDPSTLTKLEDMDVVLEAMKKIEGCQGFKIQKRTQHDDLVKLVDYDLIYGDFYVKKGTTEVVNYYATEDYADYAKMLREWYQKGYINQDVATGTVKYTATKDTYGVTYTSYAPGGEFMTSAKTGSDITYIPVTPAVVTNNSLTGSVWSIYNKCKQPELAMDFLELLNTDPVIKNLFVYGIEGRHYNLENGKVVRIKDAEWGLANARTGNVYNAYLEHTEPDNLYTEIYPAYNEMYTWSEALGFWPDVTSVEAELLACNAVKEEYASLLSCGAVNPDEYIPMLQKALEDAGVEKVAAELQKQYDAWLLAK